MNNDSKTDEVYPAKQPKHGKNLKLKTSQKYFDPGETLATGHTFVYVYVYNRVYVEYKMRYEQTCLSLYFLCLYS